MNIEPKQKATSRSLPSKSNVDDPSAAEVRPVRQRYLESGGFVAVWMAIGVGLRFSGLAIAEHSNLYLLLGIPLMLLFQRFVRKEPLQTLWVRDWWNFTFRLSVVRVLSGVILAATPTYLLVHGLRSGEASLVLSLWLMAAIVGAFAAAITLQNTSTAALRKGLPSFLAASAIGIAIMAAGAFELERSPIPDPKLLTMGGQYLVLYFAVCFAIEEVVFRGMIDSHVQPLPVSGRSAWLSAVFVSLLWGLWHLPVADAADLESVATTAALFSIVHVAIGVPLSFCWRSSGTLLLPSLAQALIDAYRNVVMPA